MALLAREERHRPITEKYVDLLTRGIPDDPKKEINVGSLLESGARYFEAIMEPGRSGLGSGLAMEASQEGGSLWKP